MPTRMGAARCEGEDSLVVGQQAAQDAMNSLDSNLQRRLVIAFVSTRHDLPKCLSGIRAVTGETPLIG